MKSLVVTGSTTLMGAAPAADRPQEHTTLTLNRYALVVTSQPQRGSVFSAMRLASDIAAWLFATASRWWFACCGGLERDVVGLPGRSCQKNPTSRELIDVGIYASRRQRRQPGPEQR